MRRLPAEFEKQSFIQVIFPHKDSDWAEYLDDAEKNFIDIIDAITCYQDCLVVCQDVEYVRSRLKQNIHLHLVQAHTDDTWARDCSAICVYEDERPKLLDFEFTAWGDKFDAGLDNRLSQELSSIYESPMQKMDFILEGGAIESNGQGTLLITSECVFNPNRNNKLSKKESIEYLKETLGLSNIIALEHGYLSGDDTDSHIDTLARFSDAKTIAYIKCEDRGDEHYEALQAMEAELNTFKDQDGLPFRLVPLPFTRAIHYDQERLPATYANFLILDKAVLVPTYEDPKDKEALAIFKDLFSNRDIIPIDCRTLIRQHGSLHCVTMQFPRGVNLKT